MQLLCAEEERWPDIARGYVLYREPDGSGPRFNICLTLYMLKKLLADRGGGRGRGEGGGYIHIYINNKH